MKVCIPINKALRGPHIFCNRLFRALQEFPEVELVESSVCDVHLHSATIRGSRRGVKNILRLDGVYHHVGPEYDWREKNKPIKKSFDIADGIIYQSNFSKQLCDKYLGKAKVPYDIIYNGDDPEKYASIVHRGFAKRPFFLAVANWRPFKRLKDIIESFLIAKIADADLVVIGDVSRSGIDKNELKLYAEDRRISFLGSLNQELVTFFLAQTHCSAFVHLSWIDNCPNSVVEALCAGIPVICGNVGGTKEIVQEAGGVVLQLEKEYNLEPTDLYHPKPIERSLVAEAMHYCLDKSPNIQSSNVDIRNVAKQYLEFFKLFC